MVKLYVNYYGKKVYTVPNYWETYSKHAGIFRSNGPTVSVFSQFFKQLYGQYEREEEEFLFKESIGKKHIIFAFENPKTTEGLNYSFLYTYNDPHIQALLGNKTKLSLKEIYLDQSLRVEIESMSGLTINVKICCADLGKTHKVLLGDAEETEGLVWWYDSSTRILTVNVEISGKVHLVLDWNISE